jgi:pimeloyl-ACP methyl ester carboxylesterase
MFELLRALLIKTAKSVTQEDLNRFIVLADSMRGFDVTDELEKIACPVFAIGSKDDRILGADETLRIAEHLGNRSDFELFLYDGYGHAVYDIAPDFKERMLDFLIK